MSGLVVVATNNGKENLERFFDQKHTQPVLVVDTGTTDLIELRALSALDDAPGVAVTKTPYRGYDTGAYLWAYYRFEADIYLFLQDSVTPRVPDYFEQMAAALPKDGVLAWSGFSMRIWDGDDQRRATEYIFSKPARERPDLSWPEYGIFGPIFMATRTALDRLRDLHLLPPPPTHKEMAQGMERGWAMAFHRAGVPVQHVVREWEPRREGMAKGEYPLFTKTFRGRT